MGLHARARVRGSDFALKGGCCFRWRTCDFLAFFLWRITDGVLLTALWMLCLSASPLLTPLLVIVSLAPHRPVSPVTIDIRDSSGIGLRSLKFDSCLRSMLQRICTGEHLVHMHPVNVWFLGEGLPFQRRWRDIW